MTSSTRYLVYKVWSESHKQLILDTDSHAQADRLKKSLNEQENRDWQAELWIAGIDTAEAV